MKIGLFEVSDVLLAEEAHDQNGVKQPTDFAIDRMQKLSERVWRGFTAMAPYLPDLWRVNAWLDIGSGLAAIDVLLARHYGPNAVIHLLDGTGGGRREVFCSPGTKPWDDVRRGLSFLKVNAVQNYIACWHPQDVNAVRFNLDMIISLKSWGHHYPVATYLELAKRSLKPGGTLILDIRNGTDGVALLEANSFERVAEIQHTAKCRRYKFVLTARGKL